MADMIDYRVKLDPDRTCYCVRKGRPHKKWYGRDIVDAAVSWSQLMAPARAAGRFAVARGAEAAELRSCGAEASGRSEPLVRSVERSDP